MSTQELIELAKKYDTSKSIRKNAENLGISKGDAEKVVLVKDVILIVSRQNCQDKSVKTKTTKDNNVSDTFGKCLDILCGRVQGKQDTTLQTLIDLVNGGGLTERQEETANKFIKNRLNKTTVAKKEEKDFGFINLCDNDKKMIIEDIDRWCRLFNKFLSNKGDMSEDEWRHLYNYELMLIDYKHYGLLPKTFKYSYYLDTNDLYFSEIKEHCEVVKLTA